MSKMPNWAERVRTFVHGARSVVEDFTLLAIVALGAVHVVHVVLRAVFP